MFTSIKQGAPKSGICGALVPVTHTLVADRGSGRLTDQQAPFQATSQGEAPRLQISLTEVHSRTEPSGEISVCLPLTTGTQSSQWGTCFVLEDCLGAEHPWIWTGVMIHVHSRAPSKGVPCPKSTGGRSSTGKLGLGNPPPWTCCETFFSVPQKHQHAPLDP